MQNAESSIRHLAAHLGGRLRWPQPFSFRRTHTGFLPMAARCEFRVDIQDRQVSVFTSPSVLRTGLVDISVLVQMAQTGSVCQDAVIRVELTSLDQPSTELTEKATAEAATNKLFKSAIFNVPYAGRWHVRILLDSEDLASRTRC